MRVMPKLSADEAKARFGELLDRARQEPITIEKHGRPVAVVMSSEEFDHLQAMKLGKLKTEVAQGLREIEEGDFIEVDDDGLADLFEKIKIRGRDTAKS